MTTIQFLAEWALRSAVLILGGALLLWVLRVKDASVRLAAWSAILCGSLAIPLLTATLPKVPIVVMPSRSQVVEAPVATAIPDIASAPVSATPVVSRHFDWARAAVIVYGLIALTLLLRLGGGLGMSLRLLRRSRATERSIEGVAIRESDAVSAPVTLGIVRPAIVLPVDWRDWNAAKLDAVLAHERSHIRRFDPAVQFVSAIHRALLWYSPPSWFLHRRIVRTAEEASDDAAVAATGNREFYAEVLLDFMKRGTSSLGVPMARYGRADRRIHRILEGTVLSRGVTRWSVAAIFVLAAPLAYLVATAHASQAQPAPQVQPLPTKPEAPAVVPPPAAKPSATMPRPRRAPDYLTGLGTVSATTLNVTAKVEGELKSINFEEGKPVEAGQLLASISPQNAEAQLERELAALAQDLQRLKDSAGEPSMTRTELENEVKADREKSESLQALVKYGQVRAPFAGVAGLRKIDPGNFVHPGDTLVVITQMQPVAVIITIPEDALPQVLTRFRAGESMTVEAWNRDMSQKIATGHLTAVDNQIDEQSGTVKLKAMFDNKDSALFPNQFVSARVLLNTR